ncbi:hypothetical protein [Halospina sp. K52047b]|uniref:hypothetical protein n=1 Tax=Halospina sp. K52047b TaxID=2614160 RepID=UPI00124A07FF|nr:hypothetical protein [Halospina sp. K52047b]KAA8977774.1 hypothetical protein F3089_14415 [Halospina sp. K52047b]
MPWQLSGIQGSIGAHNLEDVLSPGLEAQPLAAGDTSQCRIPGIEAEGSHERLRAVIEPLLLPDQPNWVMLPSSEQNQRLVWENCLGDRAEIGFGRGWSALAMSQLNRLGTTGRMIAARMKSPDEAGMEAVVALDWTPSDSGLELVFSLVDGRPEGGSDPGDLVRKGVDAVSRPEALLCPGNGSDGYLEQLTPALPALGDWVQPEVRWAFPEAPAGTLGVAGNLFGWAWLVQGYRLGEFTGSTVVLAMDGGPLAGLSGVRPADTSLSAPDSGGT